MEESEGAPAASLVTNTQPEEEGGSEAQSCEKHDHLPSLGNQAFKDGKFLQAINMFTQALRQMPTEGSGNNRTLELLANRSAAYASLSQQYLTRPANRSECSALYGPDPGCLNARALADAKKVLEARPQWAKAHSLLGTALLLSEKYEDARHAFQTGLQLSPGNQACKDGLQKLMQEEEEEEGGEQVQEEGSAQSGSNAPGTKGGGNQSTPLPENSNNKRARLTRVLTQHADDCDCALCLKLLFEPVTLPCGHSFCRSCLTRALDHRSRCPVCRTVVHVGSGNLPVTVVLQRILRCSFPEEYAERAAEEEAAAMREVQAGKSVTLKLPLFVMTTIMPGERIALNIFEPRYRLLLRRVMEGNRRLGMAEVSLGGELADVAVEAEIVEYTPQPDGRYFVELVGRRRVKLQSCHDLDGYRVATAEVIEHDDQPAEDSPEAAALSVKANEVLDHLLHLLDGLTSWAAQSPGRLQRVQELIAHAGPRPTHESLKTPQGAEALSFWAAAFASTLASTLDRCKLLRMRNTKERLEAVQELI